MVWVRLEEGQIREVGSISSAKGLEREECKHWMMSQKGGGLEREGMVDGGFQQSCGKGRQAGDRMGI